jgi:hypothetical protein
MRINYIIVIVLLLVLNVILWIYVIAFSGIYPVSGKGVIITSVVSFVLYFGIIQNLVPLISGLVRILAVYNSSP